MSDSDYRNRELGLRGKEIDTNEALRKQQAAAEQVYRSEALGEKRSEHQDTESDRAASRDQALQIHNEVAAQRQDSINLQAQIAAARDQETKDKLTDTHNQHVVNSVQYAKGKAQEAAEAAWKDAGYRNTPFWGQDHDTFVADFKKKHTLDFLSIQDPKALEDADADPDVIAMAKDRQAANARATKLAATPPTTPSEKLKAAGKAPAASATIKTSQPDTPPGQYYHINGKSYSVKGGVATEVPNGG